MPFAPFLRTACDKPLLPAASTSAHSTFEIGSPEFSTPGLKASAAPCTPLARCGASTLLKNRRRRAYVMQSKTALPPSQRSGFPSRVVVDLNALLEESSTSSRGTDTTTSDGSDSPRSYWSDSSDEEVEDDSDDEIELASCTGSVAACHRVDRRHNFSFSLDSFDNPYRSSSPSFDWTPPGSQRTSSSSLYPTDETTSDEDDDAELTQKLVLPLSVSETTHHSFSPPSPESSRYMAPLSSPVRASRRQPHNTLLSDVKVGSAFFDLRDIDIILASS